LFRLRLDKEATNSVPFPVDDELVRIGSGTHVEIHLGDASVSREHCEIRRTGTQYRLIDLESKQGTRVNGDYVNQCVLDDGDVVDVGDVRMTFERDSSTRTPDRLPRVEFRPRGPMPRRRAAPTSALLVAGSVVALLLIVVAVSSLRGSSDDDLSHNERIYKEMRELKDQRLYADAIVRAELADPSSDRETYDRIQRLKIAVEHLYRGDGPLSLQKRIRENKEALDVFITNHEGEYGVIRRRIEQFLEQYGEHTHISYVAEVRELARRYEDLGGGGDPELEKYSDAYAIISREAKKDRKKQDFKGAMARHTKFLEQHADKMPPDVIEDYRVRVDRTIAEIEQEIDAVWKKIVTDGEALIRAEQYGEAAAMFRSVVNNEAGWPARYVDEARHRVLSLRGRFGVGSDR
jgi:hypothetical protein